MGVEALLVAACALAASGVTADAGMLEAPSDSHWEYAALPLINYSSDTGLGLGLRGKAQRFAALDPNPLSVELQAYGSTGGVQFHFLYVDVPRVIGSAWRLDATAGYYRDTAAPYYGLGNHPAPDDSSLPADVYTEEAPLVRLRLRRPLWGRLWALAGYRWMLLGVSAAPSSLLAQEAPFGSSGGRYGELSLGVAWDSRDDEASPRNGVLAEASVRTTQRFLGSEAGAYGAFASVAGYRALGPRVVLAARAALDATWGDVPFDRLQDFGSLVSPFYLVDGVGGGLTVRGLLQSEYVGATKAVGNLELRVHVVDLRVFRQDFALSALAFADAGRVWLGADPPGLPDGGVHAGTGGGLRIQWGRHFVLRADVGYAEGRARVYADFGHIF